MRIEKRFSWGDVVYPLLFLGLHLVLYHHVVDLGFTGGDTFSLIESSRLGTPWEVWGLLSSRFMAGTFFFMDYYRPVTSLSFAMDYGVWGLNPVGYHLTDLVLQGVALTGCFLFLRTLIGVHVGGVGTLLFTAHPILVEVVPAVARRQDVLAGLFSLFFLWTFLLARRGGRTGFRVFSSALFVLAVASKESAVVMLIFPFIHAWLFPRARGGAFMDRLRDALRAALPYLVSGVAFWVWRSSVLGTAVGGRVYAMSARALWFRRVRGMARMAENVLPFLRVSSLTFLNLVGILLVLLLVVGWVIRRLSARNRSSNGTCESGVEAAFQGLVGLSVIIVVGYPFYAFGVRSILRQAYHGTGFPFVSAWMHGKASTPLSAYLSRARQLWLGGWLAVAGMSALPAWGWPVVRMVREPGRYRRSTRLGLVLSITSGAWLLTLVYLVEFTPRNLYFPVLFLCGLLALFLVKALRVADGKRPDRRGGGPLSLLAVILAGWTLCYSPLVHHYAGWGCASRTVELFLRTLPQHADPAETRVLKVTNFPPGGVRSPGLSVRSATSLSPYSVVSWYRLHGRATALESVEFTVGPRLEACPDSPDDWAWSVERGSIGTEVSIRWFP